MDKSVNDMWSELVSALDTMTTDRATEPVALIGPTLDQMMRTMLDVCYSTETTPANVTRIATLMRLCYQYGKSNHHLNQILQRKV